FRESRMPRIPLAAALAALVAVATAGCGIVYKQPIYQGTLMDKEAVDQLQAGMSKQQVQVLLGSPSIADPFHPDRWDYTASERTERLGHVELRNFTGVFQNDGGSRWGGEDFPEQDEERARRTARDGNLAPAEKK